MPRIIKSLVLVIGATGVVSVGASGAFFSDIETSSGNTFTAGAIDLKIDHTKQTYNGEECEDSCVEQQNNLFVDGSFENPEVSTPQNWNIFDSPAGGWSVAWRDDVAADFGNQVRPDPAHMELHEGVLGAAFEGDQYVELDSDWGGPTDPGNGEPASTVIYQDIATVPGAKYKISFKWAARPNTILTENKILVGWGGVTVHDTGFLADPNSGITWITVNVATTTATTTTTRISFTDGGTANSLGSFVDDMRIVEVVCTPQIGGGQCNLWDEKDLGEGDTFWDFSDVKPGDRGTNVISLHVYDNDAFACLLTENIKDDENTHINPEQDAGDATPGPIGNGELSPFIELFVWNDDNDGVYEVGEDDLYQGLLADIPTTMEKLSLSATTTDYLGLAWCFGEQTVDTQAATITCDGSGSQYDVAQTDSLTADLVFEAVQQRNNPDFSCSSLVK